ncbi:MAG: ABC transporter substrate-binding protein [Xenococcaceae cyanobacterium MO_207.B15]|nr:ABC transporter substrate-binding protein [Xenococcaceae cyanobacterium MO_207.B15]
MTKITKTISTIALLFLTGFLLTFNTPNISTILSQDSSTPAPISEKINMGYSNWSGWWLWEIAKEEHLFEKNGVEVSLKWFDNYSESLSALAGGYLDANCQTLNDTITQVDKAINGEVVVLVNDNSAGNDKIIASKDIKKISDLKSKKVALEEGVVGDFLLSLALKEKGMSRDDVRIINIETGAAASAFSIGKADAVGAFPPYWLKALKREGSHELISSKDFPGAIPDLLVVSQKLIDERPDAVQGLVNTWFDILDFISKNPERAEEIISERAGVTSEELKLFSNGVKLFDKADNINAFTLGKNMKHLNYSARAITEFLISEFDALKRQPDYKRLLNSNFVLN